MKIKYRQIPIFSSIIKSMALYYLYILFFEIGGKGVETKEISTTITKGEVDVIRGFKSYVLKNENGNVANSYSISAGLDYPSIGVELSYLYGIKRIDCKVINN